LILPTGRARARIVGPCDGTSLRVFWLLNDFQASMGTRSRAPSSSSVVTNSLPKLDLPPGNLNQRYPSSVPAWARPKSPTPSQRSRSSRQSSPDSVHKGIRTREDASEEDEEDVLALSAGCQPDEVYKASLPRWRYNLRRRLVRGVEVESPILARIQVELLMLLCYQ
jgi:hypothetical protein